MLARVNEQGQVIQVKQFLENYSRQAKLILGEIIVFYKMLAEYIKL